MRARRGRGLAAIRLGVIGPGVIGLAASGLAACGSAGTASGPPTSSTTAPHAATSTTATSTTVTSTTAAAPGGLAYLTAWGATQAGWDANHTHDPGAPANYWPKLPSGFDTYTNMNVVNGRVVGYVLNLYPTVSLADAKSRLANDLPLDTAATGEQALTSGSPGCDRVIESGPTVRAVDGNAVVADFESAGNTYDGSAVTRINVSPLGPGATPPAGC